MKLKLLHIITFLTCVFYVNSISIPIHRQKSPLETSSYVKNINGHSTDWLKPKPTPTYNDTVTLFRYLDSEFYGIIKIGYKAKPYNMILDTTWGDSWVMSNDCPYTKIGCWLHNKYDHTESSTYVANGTKFKVDFKTYSISGYLSEDIFYFSHINVTNQTFAEITNVPYYYALSKADGVLGLGYSSLSQIGNPIFYNLIKQGKIKRALFSIYMNRDPSSNHGGTIYLGEINYKHILHNESFTYLPVNQTGYWQFKMDLIVMNDGKKSYSFCNDGCQAIADTATTSIMGPSLEVDKIHKLIKARLLAYNLYQVDCDTIHKLPEITFVLAGKKFKIHGRDYIRKLSYKFITICLSTFVPRTNDELWVLGGAFLTEFYTVYDLEQNQIGFVKAA